MAASLIIENVEVCLTRQVYDERNEFQNDGSGDGCRDRERVIPPLFFRVCPNTVEPRTDVVAIYSWRRALLDLFSPDRKIQAVDPNGSLEERRRGEKEREREREMARGEWTRVEARGKNRAERERFGEQRQKRLERISKDVSSREKKRNGLIIMLSTRFIN